MSNRTKNIAVFLGVLWIVLGLGAAVYSFHREAKLDAEVAALRTATETLQRNEKEPHLFGAGAGFDSTGRQWVDLQNALEERAKSGAAQIIAANSCTNIDILPVTADHELDWYWGGIAFNYDVGLDASMNCDGGVCSAYLTSILPADFHGGGLCVMGGPTCAGTDGGGIDTKLLSFPPGNATNFGGTEQLAWASGAKTLVLQACCGTQACRAAGRISGQRWLATPLDGGVAADTGVDAADAADAADSSDAGPPPTVSLVTPNLGFATGGSSVVITGTGFVTGAVASINGNNCTSTTFTSSVSVTCAGTPAAVLTGTGATNEAVKVTNPSTLNGTGSGKIASFHYLSANVTPLALHWSTTGIHTATGISQIDDQLGLNNLVQATGGNQPPAPSGSFNGVASLPFSVFNGSSHSLSANPLSTSITSGLATVCTVGSMVVSTGVQVTSSLNAASTTFIWAGTASNAWDFTTNSPGITFGSTDTSPHVWCYLANGTTTSQASVDNTVTTGNLTGTGTLVNFTLGALGNAGPRAWANFNWVGDMIWNGNVATSDQTNDRALLLAVSSP